MYIYTYIYIYMMHIAMLTRERAQKTWSNTMELGAFNVVVVVGGGGGAATTAPTAPAGTVYNVHEPYA